MACDKKVTRIKVSFMTVEMLQNTSTTPYARANKRSTVPWLVLLVVSSAGPSRGDGQAGWIQCNANKTENFSHSWQPLLPRKRSLPLEKAGRTPSLFWSFVLAPEGIAYEKGVYLHLEHTKEVSLTSVHRGNQSNKFNMANKDHWKKCTLRLALLVTLLNFKAHKYKCYRWFLFY